MIVVAMVRPFMESTNPLFSTTNASTDIVLSSQKVTPALTAHVHAHSRVSWRNSCWIRGRCATSSVIG